MSIRVAVVDERRNRERADDQDHERSFPPSQIQLRANGTIPNSVHTTKNVLTSEKGARSANAIHAAQAMMSLPLFFCQIHVSVNGTVPSTIHAATEGTR